MKLFLRITFPILVVLIWVSYLNSFVFSGDYEGYSTVTGVVDGISVCGDGIVEGQEDCEPSVALTDDSCTQFGYDKGTISCDISCSYDVLACEYAPPKSVLPPFPNIFEPEPLPPVFTTIPFFLTMYDVDLNGEVDSKEYCNGLTYWLKKWRIRLINSQEEGDIARIARNSDTCDLNFDKNCNLTDVSIFLSNAL